MTPVSATNIHMHIHICTYTYGYPKPTEHMYEREETELSAEWIDRYVMALEEPEIEDPHRGVTKVDLPKYDGSPLKWFSWIGFNFKQGWARSFFFPRHFPGVPVLPR